MTLHVLDINGGAGSSVDYTASAPTGVGGNASVNPTIVEYNAGGSEFTDHINCFEIHKTRNNHGTSNPGTHITNNLSTANFMNRAFPAHPNNHTTFLENVHATPGYRVRSSTTISLTAGYDHFVLLYADDGDLHHFAKITELVTYDTAGDGFEFEPRLKQDIPKGTKFEVYRGPQTTNTNVVAVAYGLRAGTNTDKHNHIVNVSRNTFYFYNDRIDNANNDELAHNTKYEVKKSRYTGSGTVTTNFCFLTTFPNTKFDSSNSVTGRLLDKSRFSHKVKIVDNSIIRDRAQDGTWYNNYAGSATGSYTFNATSWDTCYLNGSRETYTTSSTTATGTKNGPDNYVRYVTSPEQSRRFDTLTSANISKSINVSGNYAEITLMDMEKILDEKIKLNDDMKVRVDVTKQKFGGLYDVFLPGDVYTTSSASELEFRHLTKSQDLTKILSAPGTLRIGDYIYSISSIASKSGDSQIVTVRGKISSGDVSYYTGASSGGGNTTLDAAIHETLSGVKAYRRAWNPSLKNLMVNFPIDTEITSGTYATAVIKKHDATITNSQSDMANIEIEVFDTQFGEGRFTITAADKHNSYAEITDYAETYYQLPADYRFRTPNANFVANIIDLVNSPAQVVNVVFDGSVEVINSKVENGILSYEISGRDDLGKLLSRINNKKYLYSDDFVYSSEPPLGTWINTNFGYVPGSNNADISETSSTIRAKDATGSITKGDLIFYRDNSGSGENRMIFLGVANSDRAHIAITTTGTFTASTNRFTYVSGTDFSSLEVGMTVAITNAVDSSNNATVTINAISGATGYLTLSAVSADETNDEITLTVVNQALTYADKLAVDMNISENITAGTNFTSRLAADLDSNSNNILWALRGNFSLGKSLISDPTATSFPSNIRGAMDKGVNFITGTNIDRITGAHVSDLPGSKGSGYTGSDAVNSLGYSISNSVEMDDNLSPEVFRIYNSGTDTTAENIATVSSMSDYEIIDMEKIDDDMNKVTVAPLLPVVLGRIDYNTSTDKAITAAAGANTETVGIYLVNVNGLPQGGFIHVLNSETISGKPTTFMGRLLNDTNTSSPQSYSNFIQRYGPSIYRYVDLETGNPGEIYFDDEIANRVTGTAKTAVAGFVGVPIYKDDKGRIMAHATGLKIGGYGSSQYYIDNDFDNEASLSFYKDGPFEMRGPLPVLGSNFYDTTIEPAELGSGERRDTSNTSNAFERRWYDILDDIDFNNDKTAFELLDPKTPNMFLLCSGDILPDSKKRVTHIGGVQRNLTDYSIIFKGKPEREIGQSHQKYSGALKTNIVTDEKFVARPISSASTTSNNINRFGIIRLVEMTMDWHFNPVDIENIHKNDSYKDFTSSGIAYNQYPYILDGKDKDTFADRGLHGSNQVTYAAVTSTSQDSYLTLTNATNLAIPRDYLKQQFAHVPGAHDQKIRFVKARTITGYNCAFTNGGTTVTVNSSSPLGTQRIDVGMAVWADTGSGYQDSGRVVQSVSTSNLTQFTMDGTWPGSSASYNVEFRWNYEYSDFTTESSGTSRAVRGLVIRNITTEQYATISTVEVDSTHVILDLVAGPSGVNGYMMSEFKHDDDLELAPIEVYDYNRSGNTKTSLGLIAKYQGTTLTIGKKEQLLRATSLNPFVQTIQTYTNGRELLFKWFSKKLEPHSDTFSNDIKNFNKHLITGNLISPYYFSDKAYGAAWNNEILPNQIAQPLLLSLPTSYTVIGNFNATANTFTRTGGDDMKGLGIGANVVITGSSNGSNNATETITENDGTTLTFSTGIAATTTDDEVTFTITRTDNSTGVGLGISPFRNINYALHRGSSRVINDLIDTNYKVNDIFGTVSSTAHITISINGTFANSGSTLTRVAGNSIVDLTPGREITIAGSANANNNGNFEIKSVSGNVITLADDSINLVDESTRDITIAYNATSNYLGSEHKLHTPREFAFDDRMGTRNSFGSSTKTRENLIGVVTKQYPIFNYDDEIPTMYDLEAGNFTIADEFLKTELATRTWGVGASVFGITISSIVDKEDEDYFSVENQIMRGLAEGKPIYTAGLGNADIYGATDVYTLITDSASVPVAISALKDNLLHGRSPAELDYSGDTNGTGRGVSIQTGSDASPVLPAVRATPTRVNNGMTFPIAGAGLNRGNLNCWWLATQYGPSHMATYTFRYYKQGSTTSITDKLPMNLNTGNLLGYASNSNDVGTNKVNSLYYGRTNADKNNRIKTQVSGAEVFYKPVLNTDGADIVDGYVYTSADGKMRGRVIIDVYNANDSTNYTHKLEHANETEMHNRWIHFCPNLAGNYLVSEAGSNFDTSVSTSNRNIHNNIPTSIHKIVNHRIARAIQTSSNNEYYRHIIDIDNVSGIHGDALSLSGFYRVMKISQDTFYDFTPNEIKINCLSKNYSKIPYVDACFSTIDNFGLHDDGPIDDITDMYNEGLLSMFMFVEVDGRGSVSYTDVRTPSQMVHDTGADGRLKTNQIYNMFLTDGHNKHLTTMTVTNTATKPKLLFGEMKKMNGVVSVGETFTVDVFRPPSFRTNRAAIGVNLHLVDEAEQVINDLFERTDITYTTTTDASKYFEAFDVQGLDSFAAANLVAGLKDRRVIVDGKEVKLVKNLETIDYTDIVFSENSTYNRVVNISRDNTLYDFFNEITVYGNGVKSTVRDSRSIKEHGLKQLEEVDLTIITKEAAYRKAKKLLKVHREANNGIKLTTLYTVCPFLKPGQIITVSYPSQKIPRNDYVVLEIDYEIGNGLIEITAGVYTKNLTNRIAELVSNNKKTDAALRGNRQEADDLGTMSQASVRIRGVKLKISDVTSSGGSSSVFGFGSTYGFSATFGFSGSGSGSGPATKVTRREYDLI